MLFIEIFSMGQYLIYCHLVGPDEDEVSIIEYTNKLTIRYIEYQVQYFPNTQRVIDFWVVTAY